MLDLLGPRETILVTTRGALRSSSSGVLKDNLAPVDWHMPCSTLPPQYAICLGKEQLTTELIRTSGFFVINFMPFQYHQEIATLGKYSGRMEDKKRLTSLHLLDCNSLDCPRVKEACGYLECELAKELDMGSFVLFIGSVKQSVLLSVGLRPFHEHKDQFTTTRSG